MQSATSVLGGTGKNCGTRKKDLACELLWLLNDRQNEKFQRYGLRRQSALFSGAQGKRKGGQRHGHLADLERRARRKMACTFRAVKVSDLSGGKNDKKIQPIWGPGRRTGDEACVLMN